jgi:hypothetical protein
MTSQRDETMGHMADDEMTDDPIVVERHDEILGGPPVDDPEADDVTAREAAADDSTPAGDQPGEGTATDQTVTGQVVGDEPVTDRSAADSLADDELATDQPAGDELAGDELGGDELGGRHAAPETGRAGLEQDPPPLVVPSDPVPGDPAAPSGAVTSDAQAAVPESEAPVTPGAGTVDAGTPAASPSEPAGPNGDGVPAAALAGQQWPAIQAMFVDDPKGSVERAAAAADEVAKAFVASLQREQTALRATWEKDTTTEDLRTALQQYRAFCGRLEGLA